MSQPDAAITILSDMRKGVPRLCVPAQSRGLASVTHNEANLRGMRRTSICKSVRSRSAYNLFCGLAFSLFLPHLFFIGDLLLPLFQLILLPLPLVLLLEEHRFFQRGMESLDGKLL